MNTADSPRPGAAPLPFAEFVALLAALLALGALGIDAMLPALGDIGRSLGLRSANDRQFVITVYLLSFGVGQLIHGPLSDRFGRRPILISAMVVYALANAGAALAGSFTMLLVFRALSALAIAATRSVSIALVRDCFTGRPMARIMSIIFIVFLMVPVLAPALGTAVLLVASWRMIFWTVAGLSVVVLAWFALRMPETLAPADRRPLSLARLAQGYRTTLTERASLGYMTAAGVMQGALVGYLASVEQIVAMFGSARSLPIVFATAAGTMAAVNLLNARLVIRLGSRFLSHGAVVMLVLISAIATATAGAGVENLLLFTILQALSMGCFGLAGANFSAMAMEKMGAIAGTAASLQGFVQQVAGAVIGGLIGQAFTGTTMPLHLGFLVCAGLALLIVFVTERGRLFGSAG